MYQINDKNKLPPLSSLSNPDQSFFSNRPKTLWDKKVLGELSEEEEAGFYEDSNEKLEAYNRIFDNGSISYWGVSKKLDKYESFWLSHPTFQADLGFEASKPEQYQSWDSEIQRKYDNLIDDGVINSQGAQDYFTNDLTDYDQIKKDLAAIDIKDSAAIVLLRELTDPVNIGLIALGIASAGTTTAASAIVRATYSTNRLTRLAKTGAAISITTGISEGTYNTIKTQTNHYYDGYQAGRDTLLAIAIAPVFVGSIVGTAKVASKSYNAVVKRFNKGSEQLNDQINKVALDVDAEGIIAREIEGLPPEQAAVVEQELRLALNSPNRGDIVDDDIVNMNNYNFATQSIHANSQKVEAFRGMGLLLYSDGSNSNAMHLTADMISDQYMQGMQAKHFKNLHKLVGATYKDQNGLSLADLGYRGATMAQFKRDQGNYLYAYAVGQLDIAELSPNLQALVKTFRTMSKENATFAKESGVSGFQGLHISDLHFPRYYDEEKIRANAYEKFKHITNYKERMRQTTDYMTDVFYHALVKHPDNIGMDVLTGKLTARTLAMGANNIRESLLSRMEYTLDDVMNNEDVFKEVFHNMANGLRRKGLETNDKAVTDALESLTEEEITERAHDVFKRNKVLNKKDALGNAITGKGNFDRGRNRIQLDEFATSPAGGRVTDFMNTNLYSIADKHLRESSGMGALAQKGYTTKRALRDTLDKQQEEASHTIGRTKAKSVREEMETGIDFIFQRSPLRQDPSKVKAIQIAKNLTSSALLGSAALPSIPNAIGNLMNLSLMGALHMLPVLRKMTYKNAVKIKEEMAAVNYGVADRYYSHVLGFGEEVVDGSTLGASFLDKLLIRSDQAARWTDSISLSRGFDYETKYMASVLQANELVKSVKKGKGLGRFGIRGDRTVKARLEGHINKHTELEKGVFYDKLKSINFDKWTHLGAIDKEAIDTYLAIIRDSTSRISNEALAGHQIAFMSNSLFWQLSLQFKALLLRAYEKQYLYYKRGFSQDKIKKSLALLGTGIGAYITYESKNHLNSLTKPKSERERYLARKTINLWNEEDVSTGKVLNNWLTYTAQTDLFGFLSMLGLRSDSIDFAEALNPAALNYAVQPINAAFQFSNYMQEGDEYSKNQAINNARRSVPVIGNWYGTKILMGYMLDDE